MDTAGALEPISLLVITGTMGAGKSAVLAEASDLLAARQIEHAAIDVDALGVGHLSDPATNDELMYGNLACVCANFARHGVRRFLLARAIETPEDLERCHAATRAGEVVLCRLTATIEALRQRVRNREIGFLREKYVARVEELNAILDQARLEHFSLINEGRSISDVAQQMLQRAKWISM